VASVAQHHRAISAHQSQLLAAVVELDRRRAWRVDGATSMVAWLVQRCGVSAATAREWVTAAAKLHSLPKISDALSQGKLSFDQVKPLVEVAKPETDAQLAEQATRWSPCARATQPARARSLEMGPAPSPKPAACAATAPPSLSTPT
jgi:hypothetical protein